MPEGHTVHRIALQFTADFVGHDVAVSSPQGRFAQGAALLDGMTMLTARAVGKQLFLGFGDGGGEEGAEPDRWLRVHLGLYGAWDFHGLVSALSPGVAAVGSMGAPRLRRAVRVGEGEVTLPARGEDGSDAAGSTPGAEGDASGAGGERTGTADDGAQLFPPEPVGQVRARLLTEHSLADLRGPAACVVLTPQEVATALAKAGPDPRVDPGPEAEARFVQGLTGRRTAVGQLLMDQAVVSGIGNIYRAELLFRAGLDPHTPGREVPAEVARHLWQDWTELLADGIRTGAMVTRGDLDQKARVAAVTDRSLRHAVYGRGGEPCLVCGQPVVLEEMAGRKLYWCATCQV